MSDVTEDTTALAVLSTKVDHVVKTMEEIKSSLATSTSVHVTRSEWELRNQTVDERHINTNTKIDGVKAELIKEVDEVRAELRGSRAPWWVVLTAIGSAIAIIGLALQWIPQIVN